MYSVSCISALLKRCLIFKINLTLYLWFVDKQSKTESETKEETEEKKPEEEKETEEQIQERVSMAVAKIPIKPDGNVATAAAAALASAAVKAKVGSHILN